MSYYIGFLKKNPRYAVVFKSVVKPKRTDMTYFLKVIGSFHTEGDARRYLMVLKEGYGIRENPPAEYHDRKFLRYLRELEKYKVGSRPYIETLAKAYEHLESAKDSQR